VQGQAGIPPRMFKGLVGQGHPEFSSSRQQDALEFYQHLLDLVEKSNPGGGAQDASRAFRFQVQERIQCGASGKVKYTARSDNVLSLPIPLEKATNQEEVADYERRKAEKEAAGEKL
jgi:ubiquitin carboxyl-terminal hydrolase 5/13